ncbi:YciI family protein [Lysinibacillus sp. NPDC092081]|uniref:YciI family protein n=1 Tax=Lysinibacillus sp. NPDC092081 TaxID=3364131 RepID=UPI0037FDC9BD
MFIVLVKYVQPLSVVDAFMQQHIDFLDKHYKEGHFIFSGRREPRVGGVILVNCHEEDTVKGIIEEDPFHINKIAEYELIKFSPTKFDEKFSTFIKNVPIN